MDYLYIVIGLVAGVYGFTFAKTLREDGNLPGAALVCLLLAISVGLPMFRLLVRQ